MASIEVKGMVVLVDEDMVENLSQYRWETVGKRDRQYIVRREYSNGKTSHIYMARQIMDCPKRLCVDHINGNTLDNRRVNLRVCTNKENIRNHGIAKNNRSGYNGVFWHSTGRWTAQIHPDRNSIHLGFFKTPEDAARAYDRAAQRYFGEFARLNFPEVKRV